MATLRLPHASPRLGALAEFVREAFWVIALGVIACYVFFLALGAFAPGDVVALTVAVVVLAALWFLHAWAHRRHEQEGRDPRLTAARERRGF